MNDIKLKVLNKAIDGLKLLKVQYAIIDEDGTVHGDLPVAVAKPKRASPKYPHGSLTNYVAPFLRRDLSVGGVVVIPVDRFDIVTIGSIASNLAGKTYGAGNYTGCTSKDKQSYEIMRTKDNNPQLSLPISTENDLLNEYLKH
jgi:hypothetical protein